MFYGLGPLGWVPDCAAIGSDAFVRPVQIAANGGKWDTVNREWHMLQSDIICRAEGRAGCTRTPCSLCDYFPIVFDDG